MARSRIATNQLYDIRREYLHDEPFLVVHVAKLFGSNLGGKVSVAPPT